MFLEDTTSETCVGESWTNLGESKLLFGKLQLLRTKEVTMPDVAVALWKVSRCVDSAARGGKGCGKDRVTLFGLLRQSKEPRAIVDVAE